jgi:hypothetical protein
LIAQRRERRPYLVNERDVMPTKTKPDLRSYDPELREMLIVRRNYWRAKRGQPAELWDGVHETLVDRDQHLAALTEQRDDRDRRIVEAAVAAATGLSIRGDAPTDIPTDNPAATTEPPARPLSELGLDEFRAVAAKTFSGFFDRDRSLPAPFWR